MEKADILKYFQAQRTIEIEAGKDIREFLEQSDILAVLKSGEAEFRSPGGETVIKLEAGTPLGILKNEPTEAVGSVTAVGNCVLIPLTEEDVKRLIEFNPRFASDLIKVMRNTIHDLVILLP